MAQIYTRHGHPFASRILGEQAWLKVYADGRLPDWIRQNGSVIRQWNSPHFSLQQYVGYYVLDPTMNLDPDLEVGEGL